MSPQALTELSELMRSLSPQQISRMQSLMHNAMAGFNVDKDMMEFEQSLPSSFRERMARLMYLANGIDVPAKDVGASAGVTASTDSATAATTATHSAPSSEHEARLVILRSVAQGMMTPESALDVLFPS